MLDNNELIALFQTIIKEFNLKGSLKNVEYIVAGNINDTYSVTTSVPNGEKQYIFQRVNHNVFPSPEKIAENVNKITSHIESKLREKGIADIRRRVLRYYTNNRGGYYHITPNGDYWRVISFVYNSVNSAESDIEHFRETGVAFGEFQNYLSDFPAELLHEIIPAFHDTKKRYAVLRASASADKCGRLDSVREEYEYLLSMEPEAFVLCDLNESGVLPLRVVHNDTKSNNVMFDAVTGKHLAVIDLDTVMPGLVGYDFGDAVRFAANPGGEDNSDLSKIYLDLEVYTAFAEGFVPCIMGKVTEKEIETLPDSVLAITLELAARFLTDYLNGDVYFKCKIPNHNLVRTRAQIALAKDIKSKMPQMRARLNGITDSFGA